MASLFELNPPQKKIKKCIKCLGTELSWEEEERIKQRWRVVMGPECDIVVSICMFSASYFCKKQQLIMHALFGSA